MTEKIERLKKHLTTAITKMKNKEFKAALEYVDLALYIDCIDLFYRKKL